MNKRLLHLLLALTLILGAAASHASNLQPLATGQTILQATGDDGAIQAGKPWPVPRFTDNRNGAIRDNLTGLLWSGDANLLDAGSVVAGSGGVVTWQGALDEIKRLNANAYLGFSDWRLPNLNELASLVHQGEPVQSRWLNRQGFSKEGQRGQPLKMRGRGVSPCEGQRGQPLKMEKRMVRYP